MGERREVRRAVRVRRAGSWSPEAEVDRVVLDSDRRRRRRIALECASGEPLLLDLPEATALRDGDGLELEGAGPGSGATGGIVRVVAAPEPLAEITAPDRGTLLRIAWHLGNRHLPVELLDDRLRVLQSSVIEAMVAGLGGVVGRVTAPFEPEAGAYAAGHDRYDRHHDQHDSGAQHHHQHGTSHRHG
jgi:urease accessory protein